MRTEDILHQENHIKAKNDSCFKSVYFDDDAEFNDKGMIAFADFVANQRVIKELESIAKEIYIKGEIGVTIAKRIKELKQEV